MSVFDCKMCGICCEGRGGIILTEKDTARLADSMGMTSKAFLEEYAELLDGKMTIRVGEDGACIFFRKGVGCSVHPVKPDVCRAWPFFRGNMVDRFSLAMAKEFCPGIATEASYEEFVAEGQKYLRENGIFAHDAVNGGNALLPPKSLEDGASVTGR